jgi:magnesium transporter
MPESNQPIYADDATERISLLLRLRLPWLVLGLIFGIITTLFVGQFEKLLSQNVKLAFFIPVIVYMSDAVGTQTETIYVRNLAKKQINFFTYLSKEFVIGMVLGSIFGIASGVFAMVWLGTVEVALTVGLAMFVSILAASVISLITPTVLYREHTDPAVGAGPFTTVIQDFVTLLIYFAIATLIIF